MRKSITISVAAIAVAAMAMPVSPALAARGKNPAPAAGAVISGYLSGDIFDGIDVNLPATLSGDELRLAVDQAVPVSGAVMVMANIDLPDGMVFSNGVPTLVSDEDSAQVACATENASFSWSGVNALTAQGFACGDADADGVIEFTLLMTNPVVDSLVTAEGDYAVSTQYRTNANRKLKEYSWILSQPGLVHVSATVPE